MQIFRIADERHPLWDGTGAALVGGRWNSPGRPVIYGSLSYSCAMLEMLAHASIGRAPTTHCLVIAEIPEGVRMERHHATALPDQWDTENSPAARLFGDQWLKEARSALLIVPSVVARLEWNVLVNPLHTDSSKLIASPPEKIVWDKRLFERKPLAL
ncbi:MAG: RES domain-containing protein [Sulfuricellaceae bacterium]